MSVPRPAFKWRTPAEKETAFRAIGALGYKRNPKSSSIDEDWANLSHYAGYNAITVNPNGDIAFAEYESVIRNGSAFTLVNSPLHLVAYIRRHGLAPRRRPSVI